MTVPATTGTEPGRAEALRAIRDVSGGTGAFDRLVRIASLESGFDPRAQAPTSSARGLFQFTEATWLDTVARHGADHGLGTQARALRDGADPATRADVLALRDDPAISARMAAALAADNRAVLDSRVDGPVRDTEIYLAHFLGAGGAARFINAERADAGRVAADLFPRAAAANQAVFYEGDRARSLGEVRAFFADKMAAVAVPEAPREADAVTRGAGPAPAGAPGRAGPTGPAFGWRGPVPDAPVAYQTFLALAQLAVPGETDADDGERRPDWGAILGRHG